MTTTVKRFETFQEARRLLDLHAKVIDRAKRNTMGCAYQMATTIRQMLQEHKSELLSRIEADYANSENALDAWLDDQFLLLTAMGESHADLFRAIEEGTTIEQYAGVGVEQAMREFGDLEWNERDDLRQFLDDTD